MKHILDPDGSAIDLAASPLFLEHVSANLAKKRVDLVSSRGRDGATPFGKAPADVLTITYKVRVDEQSTMDEALAILRELSQLIDEAENMLPGGMALEITPGDSAHASTAYVLVGEITDLPQEMSGADLGWYHKSPIATITLICDPFYEGPEESAGEVEGTDPLLELSIEGIKGDVDAKALAIVTDLAEVDHRYYELGLESRYYDPESPAPLLIEGNELVVEGVSGEAVEAPEWAHSSKVVKATLQPYPLVICKTGDQAHIGQWRESLRFKASSTDVYVRLAWRVGDGAWGSGDWVQAPVAEEAVEQFLDSINVPQAAVGGQRWEGRIEAYSTGEGDTLEIDYLENMPAERWTVVRAPTVEAPPGEAAGPESPGTVANDATVEGGKYGVGTKEWLNPSNAKASDDSRATAVLAASSLSNFLKATNFGFAIPEGATILGIVAGVERSKSSSGGTVAALLYPVKAGTVDTSGSYRGELTAEGGASFWTTSDAVGYFGSSSDLWGLPWTAAEINNAGFGVAVQAGNIGSETTARIDAITVTVYFAEDPDQDVILHSTRDLRIDSEDAERYDSTGTYLAPVPEHRGGEFLLPPAAARSRSTRLVSKLRDRRCRGGSKRLRQHETQAGGQLRAASPIQPIGEIMQETKWLVLEKVTAPDEAKEVERWHPVVVAVGPMLDEEHAAACGAEWCESLGTASPHGEGVYKALPWNDREHVFPPSRMGPALERSLRRATDAEPVASQDA